MIKQFKMVLSACVALVALSMTHTASAEGQLYGGVGATAFSYGTNVSDQKYDGTKVNAHVGYHYMDTMYIGFETAYTFGKVSYADKEFDYKADPSWAANAKVGVMLSDSFAVYGIAGLSRQKITIDDLKTKATLTDGNTGFNYGGGLLYRVSKNSNLSVEYLRMTSDVVKRIDLGRNALSLRMSIGF